MLLMYSVAPQNTSNQSSDQNRSEPSTSGNSQFHHGGSQLHGMIDKHKRLFGH